MGLLKAGVGALGGVLADSWREYFYCESLDVDVLVKKGEKRTGGRSSNRKGDDNIISNGSIISVNDGQCMIIVESGKVVEFCAEPGEFVYDSGTEPTIMYGGFNKENIKATFAEVGKRFTFGGDTGKDQRVYYFNTKEILGNKFGTPNPIIFEIVNSRLNMVKTVNIRCNGTYTYVISDPLLFYTRICGNVEYEYRRDQLDEQLKSEFIDALQPAFGELATLELRPAQIPAKTNELKTAMNNALKQEWAENRGLSVGKITLNPITLSPEDMQKIQQMEDAATMGSNAFMMAGRMTDATANAMETAAGNSAGAMTGFMGMGMVGMGGQGGFNAAQGFYNQGVQQQQQMQQQQMQQQQMQQQQSAPAQNTWSCNCGATVSGNFCTQCGSKKPEPVAQDGWTCGCGAKNTGKFCMECGKPQPQAEGWTCKCGSVNKGKFCMECGSPKPAGVPQYRCDKCGWEPEKGTTPPRFCPECGDPFDNGDIV